MAELNVNIGNLQLKNPVMTASGTFGYGVEYSDFMDISRLGGIFVKGTTIQPREGNLYPRMAETPSGMLNAVGLQNKGAQYFVDNIYPAIKDIAVNIPKQPVIEQIVLPEQPSRNVSKIMIFYSDNTFETFTPEKNKKD